MLASKVYILLKTFCLLQVSVVKPRHDLYLKMIKEDTEAPDENEKKTESITKYRYLEWRDCVSSSRSLGFRWKIIYHHKHKAKQPTVMLLQSGGTHS